MQQGSMHILIPLAVAVTLICAFFAFFTYDQFLSKSVACLRNTAGKIECGVKDVGLNFIIGVVVIGFLVALIGIVLFVIARFLTSPEVMNSSYAP